MSIDTTDQDLLARVRSGDTSAFGDLYAHHSAAAHRAARRIVRDQHLAEDLVSESFARVFSALRSDHGPQGDLFPYLLVTMRNVAATWGRESNKWTPVGDDLAFQPRDARDLDDGADALPVDQLAVSLTSSAFTTLPRRWRTVLWYLEVEGESATEVGERLGLTDVAVRQLARRAREGLREAYLTAYLGGGTPEGAHIPSSDLVQMARGKISLRRRTQVEGHLDSCAQCTRLLFEAAEENSTLRALAIPFYLAAGLAIAGWFGHIGGVLRFGAFKTRHLAKTAPGGVAATAGAAAVVAVVAVTLTVQLTNSSSHHKIVGANNNNGGTSTGAPSGSSSAAPTPTATTPSATPSKTAPKASATPRSTASSTGSASNTAGQTRANVSPSGTSAAPTTPAVSTSGIIVGSTPTTPTVNIGPPPVLPWNWGDATVDATTGITTSTLKVTNTTTASWGVDASFDLPVGITLGTALWPVTSYCDQSGVHVVCHLNQQLGDNLDALKPGYTSFHTIQFTDPVTHLLFEPPVTITLVPAR